MITVELLVNILDIIESLCSYNFLDFVLIYVYNLSIFSSKKVLKIDTLLYTHFLSTAFNKLLRCNLSYNCGKEIHAIV